MTSVSRQLSQPSVDDLGEPQELEPIFPAGVEPTPETWERIRPEIMARWEAVIGRPDFADADVTITYRFPVSSATSDDDTAQPPRAGRFADVQAQVVERFEAPDFSGTVLLQPTGPDQRQQVLLMEPREAADTPRPGAVVPFYHPDLMAGFDLQKMRPVGERPEVQFGRHLVQQDYVVACTEAFPYNTVPEPDSEEGFAWWRAAADRIVAENPGWTGIGKLAWDTSRAVDLLLDQPDIDERRILAMGHSLGGKMAFYAAAFDERITAVIASDFGIAWGFTNWEDPWYFGEQVTAADFTLNGHHALALIAPRSFLLIGGHYDRPESWQYINEAKRVYAVYDRGDAAGCFLHMTGHQPTEESIVTAYRWLAEQFELPERPWRLEV